MIARAKRAKAPAAYKPKKRTWRRDLRENYELYLFALPAVISIFIFNYMPMYGIQIAFKNFRPIKGIWGSAWASDGGFKWFIRFFESAQFETLITNTLTLSILLLATFPIPIMLAILFKQFRSKRVQNVLQTVSYAPHFISVVVMVGMLRLFLSPSSGLYGNAVRLFGGVPGNPLGDPNLFRGIYVWSDVWQHSGWDSIIFIAALAAVDPELYDAATVDGASRLQKILHIDVPSLLPTASILLIMRVGGLLGVGFDKVYLMQNGLNLPVSEIISTYVYKIGLTGTPQYSYSAAVGLFSIPTGCTFPAPNSMSIM